MPSDNFQSSYSEVEPTRHDVDALRGVSVLEFGAPWCPICKAAQTDIRSALSKHPDVRHLKVEDGSGRPLGRSFRIKLWPTLVVLKDGVEVSRVVRPSDPDAIEQAIGASA